MNINILFENQDFLAIDKPAGIAVHGDGKTSVYTISDWVLKHYPDTASFGEHISTEQGEIHRYGIVHRLDKDTSGVLLIAKTEKGFIYLKDQFKTRKIKKTYFAFVCGRMRDERGIINRSIGRSRESIRKWAIASKARGDVREATTRFKVLHNASPASCVELWPLTGRTHQIRVHMDSIGHPVVADPLYGHRRGVGLFGFERLALHAARLIFEDIDGKLCQITAPFPVDFVHAFGLVGIKPPILQY